MIHVDCKTRGEVIEDKACFRPFYSCCGLLNIVGEMQSLNIPKGRPIERGGQPGPMSLNK